MATDDRPLRTRRREAGLTQYELGALAGIDHSTISKHEKGKRRMGAATLRRIDQLLAERLRRG
jgi:transcriptional regulator with XRE-family HTH domain